MEFIPVWFDSLGAKSSCVLVKTDIDILIDPGAAIMHPGFPASAEQKVLWYREAVERINTITFADVVIISHYHYDHFIQARSIQTHWYLQKTRMNL